MFEAALLSIILVVFRGGFSKKSEILLIKGWYFFIAGMVIQRLPEILELFHIDSISQVLESKYIYIHLLSYLFILITLILNIRLHSVKLILAGTALNMVAIFSNHGLMPVSRNAIGTFGQLAADSGRLDFKHVLIDQNTNFPFLTDILATPGWYPLKNILSIGDIFIAVGIFILIQKMFIKPNSHENQQVSR